MLLRLEDIREYSNLELLAKQLVEGYMVGRHKSPFHGFSVEFAEHRLYNKGEDTKHIDWKVFARTDKLFVKRFEEETNLRCQIILDESPSMYFDGGQKMLFSLFSAAVLLYVLRRQRDSIGLTLFSDKINEHIEARSSAVHNRYLYSILESRTKLLQPSKKTNVSDTIHEIADKIHRRSLVIIFSDMLEDSGNSAEIFNALKHLKYNKHEVVVFHVINKSKELDFEFENRPYMFEDIESGDRVKLHPSEVRELYQKKMQEFMHEMKIRCGQYKIDFFPVDIAEPVAKILLPFFAKRKKMH
jgi:uncharacterized protein (DUF58 family)